MPAMAHIGVGFAAKRVAPEMNVGWLILAAEFIEIIFMILWALGVEKIPSDIQASFSPYSHSLIMGFFWSLLAGGIAWALSSSRRTGIIISSLVFSHTLLDIIASPKTAFYPADTGIPVFFDYSATIGLGLWRYETLAYVGEHGFVLAGLIIYFMERKRIKAAAST